MRTVPNLSRLDENPNDIIVGGVPNRIAYAYSNDPRKQYLTHQFNYELSLEIRRLSLCSQIQIKTKEDNSRQSAVPNQSRFFRRVHPWSRMSQDSILPNISFHHRKISAKTGGSMAKRFTDTGKWGKASFSELSSKMKLVWIYLCDKCNHAGIWDINLRLLSFEVGHTTNLKDILDTFGDKVRLINSSKLFIPSFVDFQYGELNPDNRAHRSVIHILEKEGASKGLISPSEGCKDKDKDKDMVKELVKEGESEGKQFVPDLEALYAKYPRKEGKAKGMAKLRVLLKTQKQYDDYARAQDVYIQHCISHKIEPQFIKTFATFANSYTDCLDADFGTTTIKRENGLEELVRLLSPEKVS